MRRPVFLWGLIVAIVIAIALNRPVRRTSIRSVEPAAPAQPRDLEIPQVDGEETVEDIESSPAPDPAKSGETPARQTKNLQVKITGGLEGAAVWLVRSRDDLRTFDASELRTDKDGGVGFDMLKEGDWAFVYAHKPGVGSGWTQLYSRWVTSDNVPLKLLPDLPLRIACVERDGSPVSGAELTVSAEFEISQSFDHFGNYLSSTYVPLPIQRGRTNDQGRCQFGGFPRSGVVRAEGGGGIIPHYKLTIKATWSGGSRELKLVGIPEKEVAFVLD